MSFTRHERFDGPIWIRDDAPIWIVRYEGIPGYYLEFYGIYKSVTRVPTGRQPWTVDNRCIATANTLEEAIRIGDEYVTP